MENVLLKFPPHLKPDPILQHHKALWWNQVTLCQATIVISDGELYSHCAKCALLRAPDNIQGGHALAQARHRCGLLQQEMLAAVEGNDTVPVVTGQDGHGRYKDNIIVKVWYRKIIL